MLNTEVLIGGIWRLGGEFVMYMFYKGPGLLQLLIMYASSATLGNSSNFPRNYWAITTTMHTLILRWARFNV